MTLVLNGTTGVSSVDGSASTPAIQGTDSNTGVFFPAADTVAIATGGSERLRADSSGNVGIGTGSPQAKLNSVSTGAALGGTAQFAVGSSSNDYENTYFRIDNSGNSNFCIDQKLSGVFYNRVLIERTTGNFKFDSGYGSVATAYGCRAWVNFNGTGVVAIRASGNVTSITDNGVGDYTVNFTTAMPDANYCAALSGGEGTAGSGGRVPASSGATTTTLRIQVRNLDNAAADGTDVLVAIFR